MVQVSVKKETASAAGPNLGGSFVLKPPSCVDVDQSPSTWVRPASTLRPPERKVSLAAVRAAHPEGIFFYYHPDKSLHRHLRELFKQALPGHLVIVAAKTNRYFPADLGVQMGDNFYGSKLALFFVRMGVENNLNGSLMPAEIDAHLPDFVNNFSTGEKFEPKGGNAVFVPGSKKVVLSGLFPEEEAMYSLYGHEPIVSTAFAKGVLTLPKDDGFHEPHNAWLYAIGMDGSYPHIDLLFTAFTNLAARSQGEQVHSFIDKNFLQVLEQQELLAGCHQLVQAAKPVSNERVVKGALNIQYVFDGSRYVALVPSMEVLGPVGKALVHCGYKVVELDKAQTGAQVQHGGGIKCRSMVMPWARR